MDSHSSKLPGIKQLQCFLMVAEELNFRRAAERLRMTQPPLTRQIKSLEETLGGELFIRTTHKVCLTALGEKLVGHATFLIGELRRFMSEVSEQHAQLRIGLTRTLNFDAIPQVSQKIKKLMGEEETEIQNLTSGQLLHSLAKGQRDVVLTGERSLMDEQEFNFCRIYQEPLWIAMPSSHPASLKEKVAPADVADLPLFWFPRHANPAFFDKCESYFSQLPFKFKRVKEPDDSLVLLSNIARNKGIALLPRSMCTFHQQGLCYRELTEEAARALNITVYVATCKNDSRERVLTAIQILTASDTE